MSDLAIRFGLGAIKAVGFGTMEVVASERKENGDFKDVYDFAKRISPRLVNKKSVEALAKAGAFDKVGNNRRQIAESFETLAAYSAQQNEESSSNQMSLFGGMAEANIKPKLKQTADWNRAERLQKEFEAFGFFLNEHPIDVAIPDLRKRGVIFSDKLERDELKDGALVKMVGVIANSKHRSSARGRFAYINISDPFGIFETMVFDEALITNSRDILVDGSVIALDCLIRRDEGGIRILIQGVKKLEDFLRNTEAAKEEFEDIKQQAVRNFRGNSSSDYKPKTSEAKTSGDKTSGDKTSGAKPSQAIPQPKKIPAEIEIPIMRREQILMLKSFLSKRIAPESEQNTTEVSFVTDGKKILLPGKFLLSEIDLLRIKNIS
jgi:DNA polymerase III alpha subunit